MWVLICKRLHKGHPAIMDTICGTMLSPLEGLHCIAILLLVPILPLPASADIFSFFSQFCSFWRLSTWHRCLNISLNRERIHWRQKILPKVCYLHYQPWSMLCLSEVYFSHVIWPSQLSYLGCSVGRVLEHCVLTLIVQTSQFFTICLHVGIV